MRLHDWAFALAAWRREHGLEGGEENPSTAVVEGSAAGAGEAAGGEDVIVAGGAQAARQYLAAGLVDRALIQLVPVLLGSGERLFEDVGTDMHGLALERAVPAPGVVHLFLARE